MHKHFLLTFIALIISMGISQSLRADSQIYSIDFSNGFQGFDSDNNPTTGAEWNTYSNPSSPGQPILIFDGKLNMQATQDDVPTLNEAILTLDLAGWTNVQLDFDDYDWNDESHYFDGDFVDHKDADGIAISNDGVNWHPIFGPDDHDGFWQNHSLALSDLADTHGISLASSSAFSIKFQQFDNFLAATDGRKWDNIFVHGTFTGVPPMEAVPEPSSLALLAIGSISLFGYGYRRKRGRADHDPRHIDSSESTNLV